MTTTTNIDPHYLEAIVKAEFNKEGLSKGFIVKSYQIEGVPCAKGVYYARDLGNGTKEFLFPDGIGSQVSGEQDVKGTYYIQVLYDQVENFLRKVHNAHQTPESASIGAMIGVLGASASMVATDTIDSPERGFIIALTTLASLVAGYLLGEITSDRVTNNHKKKLREELVRTGRVIYKSEDCYDMNLLERIPEIR